MTIPERLQALLASEFAAVHTYTGIGERCKFWGYGKLATVFETEAGEELGHARDLCRRLEELGGTPVVSAVGPPSAAVQDGVPGMLDANEQAERTAVQKYSQCGQAAIEAQDFVTLHLCEEHAVDEQNHLSWVLGQLQQIAQMGLDNYLSGQVG